MGAHSLLKLFELQPILNALNSPEGKWIYSLNYNGLITLINKEREKLEIEQRIIDTKKPIEHKPENVSHIPKQQTRKTVLNQLD